MSHLAVHVTEMNLFAMLKQDITTVIDKHRSTDQINRVDDADPALNQKPFSPPRRTIVTGGEPFAQMILPG